MAPEPNHPEAPPPDETIPPPRPRLANACLLAAFVFECASVAALLNPHGWADRLWLPWWAWHALGVCASLGAFRHRFPNAYSLHPWLVSTLVAGFTAAAPLAGVTFIWFFQSFFALPVKDHVENRYYFGERHVLTSVRVTAASARQHRSVLEVLNGRDNNVRRKAILSLRSVDPRRALPVLQKALQDGDDQVRLLAQTQYNKILAGIELSVKSLEAEVQKGDAPPIRLIQLAEQYHELVFLGLSSDEAQVIYLGRATELLEQALKLDPGRQPAQLLLLKCLVRNHKLDQAAVQLEELRKLGVRQEILLPWEADIHFQRRDWPALKIALVRMKTGASSDARLGAPIDFWLGGQTNVPLATPA